MAKKTTCKTCRRLGESLVLRGGKCASGKCAFARRPTPPGKPMAERKHRSTVTEFGTQMREKQKVRFSYGISEKQFSTYVKEAAQAKGVAPTESLYERLERRLDNAVFVLGFPKSRAHARQITSHGHITVNGKKMTIPSYPVKVGDVIAVREGSKKSPIFATAAEDMAKAPVDWMTTDTSKLAATVKGAPKLDKTRMPFNLQSVIEFYSR
ncbi:MAG TPA: 30S ribosomal protein S4 [Candidatus Paceibacterota bacterium]|nr:30S ribosomal protein S4 [Candidatus Paceibacterota bacterium]